MEAGCAGTGAAPVRSQDARRGPSAGLRQRGASGGMGDESRTLCAIVCRPLSS